MKMTAEGALVSFKHLVEDFLDERMSKSSSKGRKRWDRSTPTNGGGTMLAKHCTGL